MAGLLRNKVVAITGSSSGIGRATAIACAQQGAILFLHHLNSPEAETDIRSLEKELQALDPELARSHSSYPADITSSGAGEALVQTATKDHGRLDVLVNNAGIYQFLDFAAVTDKIFDRHMAVNATAVFMLIQAASNQMIAQGSGGSIVNIASITATLGSAQLAHYSASKAAVLGMTVSAAVALGPKGIRINCVSPGTVETPLNKADLDVGNKRAEMAARVPLRRLGRPEDIANAVVFFASDLSQYVSGQNLIVCGGSSINYQ